MRPNNTIDDAFGELFDNVETRPPAEAAAKVEEDDDGFGGFD